MRFACVLAAAAGLLIAMFVLFERALPSDPSLGSTVELERDAEARAAELRRFAASDSSAPALGEAGALGAPRTAGEGELGAVALLGHLLLPSGAPAVDVRLRLHAVLETWSAVEGISDAEGRFELRFVPPLSTTITLEARIAGFARATWRWHQFPRNAVTDLGTCALATAGRLEGRLRDREGRVPHGEWSVSAEASLLSRGPGMTATLETARVDPATGNFVFEELAPGANEIKARSDLAAEVRETYVEVPAGGVARVELVYEGIDTSRAILLSTTWRSPRYHEGQLASVVLRGSANGPRSTQRDVDGILRFEDLDPRLVYALEVEDPRILPVKQGGLRAGRSYRVELEGSAAVRVHVQNAANGETVSGYRLSIRYCNVSFHDTIAVSAIGRPEPEDGLYRGFVPGDLTLLVEAEGFAPASIALDGLATGETRKVEVALVRGGSVAGIVLRADGTPLGAGVNVALRPGIRFAEGANPFTVGSQRDEAELQTERCREGETDAVGRFSFESLPPGLYEVRACASVYAWTKTFVEIEATSVASRAELRMPPLGELVGSIRGALPAELAAMRVRVKKLADDLPTDAGEPYLKLPDSMSSEAGEALLEGLEVVNSDGPVVSVDATGRFRLAPLLVGSYRAEVLLVPPEHASDVAFPWHSGVGVLQLGEVAIQSDSATELVHDLGEHAPAQLRVQVLRVGVPVPAIHLVLAPKSFVPNRGAEARLSGFLHGHTDERGTARVEPIYAGVWQLWADAPDRSWSLDPPIDVELFPGKESTQRVEIELYEHELLILDARSGEQLADADVGMRRSPRWGRHGRTDERGRLRIALPPGHFEVIVGRRPAVPLEWSASGPSPRELRFAAPPESR